MDTLSRRLGEINELIKYTSDAEKFLNILIKDLGWSEDCLQKANMTVCPVSSSHCMPVSSLAKHVETCTRKHENQGNDEFCPLPSSNFFYTKSTTVVPVLIDKKLQQEILINASSKNPFEKGIRTHAMEVPPNVDRCVTDLTREERLAIYDYVVQKGKATNKPATVSLDDLQLDFETKQTPVSEAKSHLEILAEKRDYKRRRQSYRAKNVHITKKSYTEVLREVIANQCKFLEDTTETKIKVEPRSPSESDSETKVSFKEDVKHEIERYSSDSSPERKVRHSREHKSRSHRDHKRKRHKEHRSERRHSRSRSRK